jgi:putative membrane protein
MRTTMEKFVLSFLMCFALTANAGKVTPSDSEIVGVVATANSGEIQAAAMNKESQALAAKLGLKSEDSVTSKTLTKKSQADLKKLKELQGAEFDKEYVGDQVLMHKLVLETIENVLIPSADNAELKAMLKTAQGKVSTHLQHAKQLKDKYDK